MESSAIIRLCYTPLPKAPQRLFHGSIGSSYPRTSTIHHHKFNNHAIIATTHHHLSHFPRANCMLNNKSSSMPSENDDEESNGNKIMRGVTGASLALACVVGLFNLSSKLNPKLHTAYASWPFSTSGTVPSGGGAPESIDAQNYTLPGPKVALESLLWLMINIDDTNIQKPPMIPNRGPDDRTIRDLKVYAVSRSKYGPKFKDEAQKLLEDSYNKYKDDQPDGGLSLGLACVELLIIQGNFKGASDRLNSLLAFDERFSSGDPDKLFMEYEKSDDEQIQQDKFCIAQILLYKAIIQTMLKNKDATQWWKVFVKTLD